MLKAINTYVIPQMPSKEKVGSFNVKHANNKNLSVQSNTKFRNSITK